MHSRRLCLHCVSIHWNRCQKKTERQTKHQNKTKKKQNRHCTEKIGPFMNGSVGRSVLFVHIGPVRSCDDSYTWPIVYANTTVFFSLSVDYSQTPQQRKRRPCNRRGILHTPHSTCVDQSRTNNRPGSLDYRDPWGHQSPLSEKATNNGQSKMMAHDDHQSLAQTRWVSALLCCRRHPLEHGWEWEVTVNTGQSGEEAEACLITARARIVMAE